MAIKCRLCGKVIEDEENMEIVTHYSHDTPPFNEYFCKDCMGNNYFLEGIIWVR